MRDAPQQVFTLTEDEWQELMRRSRAARFTPVMLIGGVDVSAKAYESVHDYWRELGAHYGFRWDTVQQHADELRQVSAIPTSITAPEPAPPVVDAAPKIG